MRLGLPILLLALGLSACSGRKVPKGILEPDAMERIMWDMIRTGEFLNGFVLYRDTVTHPVLESQRWHEKVYELHNTTRDEFMRSYNYYRQHPKLMQRLFDSMAVYEDTRDIADSNRVVPPVDTFGQRRRPQVELKEKLITDTTRLKKRVMKEPV